MAERSQQGSWLVCWLAASTSRVRPNNSFKPNLLRSSKTVAGKACHCFASTTQVGLIQVLGPMFETLLLFLSVASTPAEAAESLYRKFPDFYVNPNAATTVLTPHLSKLLARDAACASESVCAFGADPWTDAQDGDIVEPITFTTVLQTSSSARVRMCYLFSLGQAQSEIRCTDLILDRASTGQWLISDLLSPMSGSIVKALEAYRYGP